MIVKSFATEQLGIQLPEQIQGELHLNDFVDVGVRDNPKRVQILASKVIPKCHMVNPHVLNHVAMMLAAKVIEHQGVATGVNHSKAAIELLSLISGEDEVSLYQPTLPSCNILTVGYADAAVALGFAVASQLHSPYVHSVHYQEEGSISFEEPHSLNSSHYLRPSAVELLSEDRPVLLVDDEITTGRTIINTIKAINAKHFHRDWYIASIIDTRSPEDVAAMSEFAEENDLNITVAALASGHMKLPANIFEQAEWFKTTCVAPTSEDIVNFREGCCVSTKTLSATNFPRASAGLLELDVSDYAGIGRKLAIGGTDKRSRLVLGIGEYSYVPFLVAMSSDPGTKLSMLNKTPLYLHSHKRYPISRAVPVKLQKSGQHSMEYLYNMEHFDEVILVLPPAMEFKDAYIESGVVSVLSRYTDNINIFKIKDKESTL